MHRRVVETVMGEFYWKVEAGEKVRGVDYVSPPYMLVERSIDDLCRRLDETEKEARYR